MLMQDVSDLIKEFGGDTRISVRRFFYMSINHKWPQFFGRKITTKN